MNEFSRPHWLVDIATAGRMLGLKKIGSEWVGPCPACSGEDRFRLSIYEGKISDNCRHNCPPGARLKAFKDRGLIEYIANDNPAPTPTISNIDPAKQDYGNWIVRIAEGNLDLGWVLSELDIADLIRISPFISPDLSTRIEAVIQRIQELNHDRSI